MIRLPYKLLIVPKTVSPRKYKRFLSHFEVVASASHTIRFRVENIGKKTFPGGEISEGRIYFENIIGMATFTQDRLVTQKELPPIHPNKTFTMSLEEWIPWYPGLWKIRIKIKSKDNAKIEFYQSRNGSPCEGDEWYQFVYAVDRHQLDLTLVLQELLEKRR